MPVRVKTDNVVSRTWGRQNSRDSLSSTDHLIAVYSMESKDPSFETSPAMEVVQPKLSAALETSPSDSGNIETISSTSWVKTPSWAVCFPPQLQANVQHISERLNLDQHKTDEPSRSEPTTPTPSSPRQTNLRSTFSVTCGGYDFEQLDDGDVTSRVLNIEESEQVVSSTALALSDEDSVSSWTSQNAVKFNKKLKPKSADAHCVKEASKRSNSTTSGTAATEIAVPASFWDTSISLLSVDKRDESEAYGDRLGLHLSTRQIQENISAKDEDERSDQVVVPAAPSKRKKSVRFTKPLVTSQHYRPKTRPEEVSMLFFDEDELELLEEDRETTSRDQFEMIAQELSENRLRISIAYQNRWRDHRRRHSSSSSGVQVSMSASDV